MTSRYAIILYGRSDFIRRQALASLIDSLAAEIPGALAATGIRRFCILPCGVPRGQTLLFPDRLDDRIGEDDLVRVVALFVNELDLLALGFDRALAARTGRPGYHPATLLKLFIYGYLNRIPSSRRLEREAGRNVEVMWLTGRLTPDHKTIAEFRRTNGGAIRKTCARFVELCRRIDVLKGDCVAIDGSKFKAVNNRDRNFTRNKIARRLAHLEADVERYIDEMVRIDRQEEGESSGG